jgi:hypothetical protein
MVLDPVSSLLPPKILALVAFYYSLEQTLANITVSHDWFAFLTKDFHQEVTLDDLQTAFCLLEKYLEVIERVVLAQDELPQGPQGAQTWTTSLRPLIC